MAIHSICGLQNSGKTLYMSLLSYLDFLSGKRVLSNYDLFFPHWKINKDYLIKMALEQPNLVNVSISLDEFWLSFDSRKAMDTENILGTYFFLQTSKNNINVRLTAQVNGQNEVRIRNNMHLYSECDRYELVNGKMVKVESEFRDLGEERNKNLFIYVKEYKQVGNISNSQYKPFRQILIRAQPFFKLFNTYEKKKISLK